MSTGGAALAAKLRLAAAPLALALAVTGCAHAPQAGGGPPEMTHPEGAIFDPSIDAHAAVDAALAQASASDTLVLIVMGGLNAANEYTSFLRFRSSVCSVSLSCLQVHSRSATRLATPAAQL